MKHTITANWRHIRTGIPHSPFRCPIALAVCDHFELECEEITVGPTFIGGRDFFIPTSTKVAQWISDFDEGRLVKPITFTLTIIIT